jgi:hypothetical protein
VHDPEKIHRRPPDNHDAETMPALGEKLTNGGQRPVDV